jgi:hypothetical protein
MSLGKLTKRMIAPERVTPAMIAELEDAFIAKIGTGTPAITGYYDARGKLRRIVGDYPDGWQLRVNIDAEGYVTSASGKLRLTMPGGVK